MVSDSIVQRTVYYASGLPMAQSTSAGKQPYKYNGKEFVEMHGLDEYDSQARWYYPAILRTTTMDPMAESYYHISPYAWCGNNPIVFVDLDGCEKITSLDPKDKRTESIEKSVKEYPENEGVIHIWVHGTESQIQIYDRDKYESSNGEEKEEDKTDEDRVIEYLQKHSELWDKVENGEAMILVLHSCEAGKGDNSIAQKLSESELLGNTIIVAPTEDVVITPSGKELGTAKTKREGKKTYVQTDEKGNIKYGAWKKFHKGKMVDSFSGKTKPIFKNPQKEIDRYEKK